MASESETLQRAEQAVVQAALAAGDLSLAQLQKAVVAQERARAAGNPLPLLSLLRQHLPPARLPALARIYRDVQAAAATPRTNTSRFANVLPLPDDVTILLDPPVPAPNGTVRFNAVLPLPGQAPDPPCEGCGAAGAPETHHFGRHAVCNACLAHAQRAGLRYDRQLVLAPLGEGAFGAVYKAVDLEARRLSALKVLKFTAQPAPQAVARFGREIELLLFLDHPHIVEGFQSGHFAGGHYLSMELLPSSLRDEIRQGPVSVRRALDVSLDLLSGLAHAHAKGVVHRDVKPQNVLIDHNGRAKLCDFGLARHLQTAGLTITNQAMGSPHTMPPEQFADAKRVDHRADLYAVGATLFHMLTGRPLFTGTRGLAALAKKVDSEVPPRVRSIRPEVNAPISDLVARCLEKKPAARPPSAESLRAEIQAAAQALR
ncbi:serine/threonine protein kinase [Planctomycetota bacterium]|nr:serine/threonine protein kinase [Planctomycetota bacterium]